MGHLIAAILAAVAGIGALACYFLLQEADAYVRLLGMLIGLASAAVLAGAFIVLSRSPNRAIAWLARTVLAGMVVAYAAVQIIDR